MQECTVLLRVLTYDEITCKYTVTLYYIKGVGMRDLAGETLEFVRKAIKISGSHYPERSFKVFIINAPWYVVQAARAERRGAVGVPYREKGRGE